MNMERNDGLSDCSCATSTPHSAFSMMMIPSRDFANKSQISNLVDE